MDTEIKERLIKYLDSIEGSVEKAVSFTEDQVPLYVQELLQYALIENVATLLCCSVLILVIVCIELYILTLIRKSYNKDKSQELFLYCFGASATTVITFLIISLPCDRVCSSALEAYKIKYCPRVYIVEQLSRLTNEPNE